jgi:hypothetical protein
MGLKKTISFETTFASYTGTDLIGEGGAGRIYKVVDGAENVYASPGFHEARHAFRKDAAFAESIVAVEFANNQPKLNRLSHTGCIAEGPLVITMH